MRGSRTLRPCPSRSESRCTPSLSSGTICSGARHPSCSRTWHASAGPPPRARAPPPAPGSGLEWYDFSLYGSAAALVFSKIIFVSSNQTVATMAAFTTFAFGYFIRPLGGLIFGRLGDVLGRKQVLVITLLVMGGATFLMG